VLHSAAWVLENLSAVFSMAQGLLALSSLYLARDVANPRVARLVLCRPEKLNAINAAMPRELRQAVEFATDADDIHVIVVQGDGACVA
jgi:enoyl-CoA hydratase